MQKSRFRPYVVRNNLIETERFRLFENTRRCRRWTTAGRKMIKSEAHDIRLILKFNMETFK